MPDLGKYADTVLGAYAVTIILIVSIILVSILRSRTVKRELTKIEKKKNG